MLSFHEVTLYKYVRHVCHTCARIPGKKYGALVMIFFFAALVSPGSVCRIHRPPTSKLHTIISCKGADALGTVRKQSYSLHVAVC